MPFTCAQCGTQNPDSAQFCYNCGAANPSVAGTIQMGAVGKPSTPPQQPPSQPASYGEQPPSAPSSANSYGQSSNPVSSPYGQPPPPQSYGSNPQPYASNPQPYASNPPYAPSNPYAAPSYPPPAAQPYSATPVYGQVGYGAMGYGGAYASQMSPASPGKRFLAVLLDTVLVFLAFLPGLIVQGIGQGVEVEALSVIGLLIAYAMGFAAGIYNIYLLGSRGATIGKKILGLQLLDDQGQPLGFGKAFLREVLKNLVLNLTCALGGLWLLFDKQNQQLYDKAITANVYEK